MFRPRKGIDGVLCYAAWLALLAAYDHNATANTKHWIMVAAAITTIRFTMSLTDRRLRLWSRRPVIERRN